MWKFFAFVMVVLLILMFIQMSTMSDEDVEKIRAQLDAQKQEQQASTAQSGQTQIAKSDKKTVAHGDSGFLSMPPVVAYEEFLNSVPELNFYSEADKFINPDYSAAYKKKITDFAADELKILKDLHDLSAMEYMDVKMGNKQATIKYIASSKMFRDFHGAILDEGSVEGLVECTVEMSNISGNWFINSEEWAPFPEVASLTEEERNLRKKNLAAYYRKRSMN